MNYTYSLISKELSEKEKCYCFENEATALSITVYTETDDRYGGRFMISVKDEPSSYEGLTVEEKLSKALAKIYTERLPVCIGGVFATDGHPDDIIAETVTESHSLKELKTLDGYWHDIYMSLIEADKIARTLSPGFCIIQAPEDIKRYQEEEKEADEAFEMMLDDFFKEKGLPADYICESDREFERLTREIDIYMQKWLEDHPDKII